MCRILIVAVLFSVALVRGEDFTNAPSAALSQSAVLEDNVLYFRLHDVTATIPGDIKSAGHALGATNKIAGTVLDLRFADGDDFAAAKSAAEWFAAKKQPLAILINSNTTGAAESLALKLKMARVGLVFGAPTRDVKPDVAVLLKSDEERAFFEHPYGNFSRFDTNTPATNRFLSFVDHTSEADLVRARIKDGDEDEDANFKPEQQTEKQAVVLKDPVLARAVDLIKGLAVVRLNKG